ncbi:hypothetical protein EVS00_01855 [Campylobacter jejuni]|nr:hypothetical protein [Campylobacter jejuni]EAH6946151.1 hypothetical protein [Campylobacter jejuni]EAH8483388.1 hypothetical protein [Campylobacter jejuni]EAM0827210.1 hypothetical protein [Campylobacter jejuni]
MNLSKQFIFIDHFNSFLIIKICDILTKQSEAKVNLNKKFIFFKTKKRKSPMIIGLKNYFLSIT